MNDLSWRNEPPTIAQIRVVDVLVLRLQARSYRIRISPDETKGTLADKINKHLKLIELLKEYLNEYEEIR